MKKLSVVIVICLGCLGCSHSEITLKDIDQDIPSALVETYNTKTTPYVDEGETCCLLLLLTSSGHVAQTHEG